VTHEKIVQLQPLPQLQPKVTVPESARALHPNFLHQHARHMGMVANLELRGKQLQLRAFALFIKAISSLL
jgi:hypothetical protein